MTTQDLNTLQEIAYLLRSGKIVQVEFIGGPIDDPYTWTHIFFSMENFEDIRDITQYRDIKILFPEKIDYDKIVCEWAKNTMGISDKDIEYVKGRLESARQVRELRNYK